MRAIKDLSDAEWYVARQMLDDGYSSVFIGRVMGVEQRDMPRALKRPTRGARNGWNTGSPWRSPLRPPRWTPDCMSPDEFELWQIDTRDDMRRPCDACPLGWAMDMRMEGRCNGIPAVLEEDEVAA